VYVPGNHDYFIWDLLSTQVACIDVLGRGEKMGTTRPVPLTEWRWQGATAFLAGVFPAQVRSDVVVEYPDHIIDCPHGTIVVTHGHYLDPKQTLFSRLSELTKKHCSEKEAVRSMFIETAQYQAVAHAVSYTPRMRKWVDYFLGHGGLFSRIGGFLRALSGSPRSALRGKSIDVGQLRAIEFYLKYFRCCDPIPDHFVYGHTHVQDRSDTSRIRKGKRLFKDKVIQVHNVGSFYPRGRTAATFLSIDVPGQGAPAITPMWIDREGQVKEA
jgi:hypothetical protein